MEPSGPAPRRASLTNANEQSVNPFAGKPVQPPQGLSRSTRNNMFESGPTLRLSHDKNEGLVVSVALDEQLDSILPAPVTRFELVSETIPLLHAGDMALEINGSFVGQCGREALWEEMNPKDLALLLQKFQGQDLLSVESGLDWLHLDLSDGWFRVVASTWEPWVMTLPKITWVAEENDDPLNGKRLTGGH